MRKLASLTLLSILAAVLNSSSALAYIGPGAGLSALGSLVSLIGALVLTVVGFVWYPIRRLLRRLRPKEPQPGE
jgi:hypothetical protein